ncbi:MAG: hypothetical protein Q8P39_02675 [Candidatus Yanofskybacteria bacterium]|nr:hypothetical protein [Candidatus Yanofskybacteria bacterium]
MSTSQENVPSWLQLRELFFEILPSLLAEAQEARKAAVSYRNFRVGCAALAFHTQKGIWEVFRGANFKEAVNARPICAEPVAIQAARAKGFDLIVGLVIVGEPQLDEDSGALLSTLTPCAECRRKLLELPAVRMQTIIVTVTPNLKTQEVRTFHGVLEAHHWDQRW